MITQYNIRPDKPDRNTVKSVNLKWIGRCRALKNNDHYIIDTTDKPLQGNLDPDYSDYLTNITI